LNFQAEPPHLIPAREESALSSYLSAVRAHRWVVVLITLAAVVASAALLAVRTPSYEATADLLVNPLPQEDETFRGFTEVVRETGDPTRTVQTAASLVEQDRAAADRAADMLGGSWTPEEVLGAIDVEPRGESNVLGVTATADNPEEAARVANEFVDAVLAVRNADVQEQARSRLTAIEARLEALPSDSPAASELVADQGALQAVVQDGDPTVTESQAALPPSGPTGVSSKMILVLALLAGFALGSGAALLLDLFARSVRDEDEALALYPMPVLARIPVLSRRALRKPAHAPWYMPPEIREPFRTLAVQLDEERGGGVILITSASAGDGKTTTAIDLAVSLAATGSSVILLDFDFRNPRVGETLGLSDGPKPADLLRSTPLESLIQAPPQLGSLRLVALKAQPEAPELVEAVGGQLADRLREAKHLADWVVVDTAPLGEVGDALRIIRDVDDILIVVRPKNTSRSQLDFLRDLLDRSGRYPTGAVMVSRDEGAHRGYYAYPGGRPRVSKRAGDLGAGPRPLPAQEQPEVALEDGGSERVSRAQRTPD
jgi:Mrp family chromosome partitioning ATPase/capsular polysaccharide biosynthesis protein